MNKNLTKTSNSLQPQKAWLSLGRRKKRGAPYVDRYGIKMRSSQ